VISSDRVNDENSPPETLQGVEVAIGAATKGASLSIETGAEADDADSASDATLTAELRRAGVVVYFASTGASVFAKRHMEQIATYLLPLRVAHVDIDVSLEQNAAHRAWIARSHRSRARLAESTAVSAATRAVADQSPPLQFPQVFVRGHAIGGFEAVHAANELGLLKLLLA
jgi:glutaredoxin